MSGENTWEKVGFLWENVFLASNFCPRKGHADLRGYYWSRKYVALTIRQEHKKKMSLLEKLDN